MLIDFSNMETEIIPHFMGGEGEIHAQMRVESSGPGAAGRGWCG